MARISDTVSSPHMNNRDTIETNSTGTAKRVQSIAAVSTS